jgi:hypothetical protein
MTTSHKEPFLSDVLVGEEIPIGKLAYFRARLRNALHDAVLKAFDQQRRESNLTKTVLARRIHRSPAQVTRWLSNPQNWTLDTISDLLVALGQDIELKSTPLGEPKSIEAQNQPPANLPASTQSRSRRADLRSGYQLGLNPRNEQHQMTQVM